MENVKTKFEDQYSISAEPELEVSVGCMSVQI